MNNIPENAKHLFNVYKLELVHWARTNKLKTLFIIILSIIFVKEFKK
jgi:hypothetical protein